MTNEERDRLILEIHEAMGVLKAKCEPCQSFVQKIGNTIYGENGNRGLTSRVSVLEWALFCCGGGGFIASVTVLAVWLQGKF